MLHAEGSHVRRMLAERYKKEGKEGRVRVYLYGVIAKEFDILMYMVHTSRGHIVDLIKHLHTQGTPIISETLVSYLGTTAHELESQGMRFQRKIKLPIRHQTDQERLWKGIQEGTDACMGTDAIPHTSKYKASQPLRDAGLGLNSQWIDSLPLLYTNRIHTGRVVDPNKEIELGVERMRGNSDYSIWQGRTVKGIPIRTHLRGQLIAQEGEVVQEKPIEVYWKEQRVQG